MRPVCVSIDILAYVMRPGTHTCKISRNQSEDQRPHNDQDDGNPRFVDRIPASLDGIDVVAAWLDDVVDDHEIERQTKAEQQIHDELPLLLRVTK